MKKKNIVVIGGGTGTYVVLSALRDRAVNLTAIVSMADDGGSTGILRDKYGALPPGDARRALVALSNSTKTMRDLFNYRFIGGGLEGHAFGNLLITALEKITGSFASALQEVSRILNINGEVIPVTLDNVRLHAQLQNGKVIHGETNIDIPKTKHRSPINKVWLAPAARINPRASRAIARADIIVIGPGDLYTSIVPNLLVRGMKQNLARSKGTKVYICNLMTKRGETDGFSAEQFVEEIERYLGKGVLDRVIFNKKKPAKNILNKYRREGAEFVVPPRTHESYILADLANGGKFMRHSSKKLARTIASLRF